MSVRWSGIQSWYRVRYADGSTVDVQVGIPDAMRWEANNGGQSLLGNQSITAMLTCVFYALRRQQLDDTKRFDEWAARVEDFAQMDDDDDAEVGELPDPTSPDQSDD
ncbi:MAG: hypothetical protein Q4F65_06940 [Propionibacteriaceae bacterium]|nr:hypothetical protein [Propionibacteriaceae bacterium]